MGRIHVAGERCPETGVYDVVRADAGVVLPDQRHFVEGALFPAASSPLDGYRKSPHKVKSPR